MPFRTLRRQYRIVSPIARWNTMLGTVSPSSLLTSLVAYWNLEEASGTRVDATGRGNDLTDNNTVTQAVGKVGNAAQFTAANSESMSRADNADLSMGDIDFEIDCWVYLDSKPAGEVVILGKYNFTTSNREYRIGFDTTLDRFRFIVSGNGTTAIGVNADTLGSPSLATWYRLNVYHDSVNNLIGIAVNNGAFDTAAFSAGVLNGTSNFVMGAYDGATAYFNGRLDEVGIWKRLLTLTERTARYNAGAGITYPFPGT